MWRRDLQLLRLKRHNGHTNTGLLTIKIDMGSTEDKLAGDDIIFFKQLSDSNEVIDFLSKTFHAKLGYCILQN
jgi:hypothetical protein